MPGNIHTFGRMSKNTTQERLDHLDAMRGIAAMMVLLGHYINWKYKDVLWIKLLSFPFNANDAVSFFFVLSGFVLSWKYLQDNRLPLAINKFYIQRLFRLFPGFAIALLADLVFFNRDQLSWQVFRETFILNRNQFWEEFFLFRGYNTIFLPGWTLTIELCMSFLMPFLIVVGRYNPRLLLPFAAATLLGAYITGLFMFHFILGIWIAANVDWIRSMQFRESGWYRYRWLILITGCVLFSLRMADRIVPFDSGLMYILNYLKLDYFIFSAIGSLIFIVYSLHFRGVGKLLCHPVLLFYGKISYGIYLIHWVYVMAFYTYWDTLLSYTGGSDKILFIAGLAGVVLLSTLSAAAIYYGVERPFINLSKKLSRKWKDRWLVVQA